MFTIPDNYYDITAGRESGHDPNAKNPRSSASGTFQFIDSTYLNYARDMFPGMDDQQLLARKNNPEVQNQIMKSFTEDNAQMLAERGHQVTPGTLYLSHFLGGGGAHKALSADPNASVAEVMGEKVVSANPFLKNMTVQQMKEWAESKYGQGGGQGAPQALAGASGTPQLAGGTASGPLDPNATMQAGPPPSLSSQFLSGGPGALFGRPQEGWNLGDTLTRVGAAMMARDNPQGAAVITKGLSDDEETRRTKLALQARNKLESKPQSWYDGQSGSVITRDANGRLTVQPTGVERPQKPLPAGAVKIIDTHSKAFDEGEKAIGVYNDLRQMIVDDKLDTGFMSRLNMNWKSAMNDPNITEKERNTAKFMAALEDLRHAKLLETPGVDTEGDAKRALDTIVPGLSSYNTSVMLDVLDKGAEGLRKNLKNNYGRLERSINTYSSYDPDGVYRKNYEERAKTYDDFETTYAPRRDAWRQRASGSTGQSGGSLKDTIFDEWKKNKQ